MTQTLHADTTVHSIGLMGGGQLARMLALAGYPLGLRFVVVDPDAHAPASALASHLALPYDAPEALGALAATDVVTYEFENVPAEAVRELARQVPVLPPPEALAVARNRREEKALFRSLGIPSAEYLPVDTEAELSAALTKLAAPAIFKACTLGYDGKGQFKIETAAEAPKAWQALRGAPAILEKVVQFERELSILAVRSRNREVRFYPVVENTHEQGILRITRAPAPALDDRTQRLAEDYAGRLLDSLDYVGVLALELFQTKSELLANEFAPRVHNSGHFSIEGAATSQFENHLRAVAGLPLGSTALHHPSAMINLIGTLPNVSALLEQADVHVHLYGKAPRPGRKLGHVTVLGPAGAPYDERTEARLRVLLALAQ